ncbi:hypothetical protein BZA70DRAFT_172495 [Myxozyma melibiosi]|uniref:Elongator complex protein 6 n=1 Tax=Myxozyma melibiosi TaxID=54550 RepID=A0ABR1F5F6_9ASCO
MSISSDLLRVFDGKYLPVPAASPDQGDDSQLLLITASLETNASWLLQHFARSCIGNSTGRSIGRRADSLGGGGETGAGGDRHWRAPVVFLSFVQEFQFYARSFKKTGVDVSSLIQKKSFLYIDGFSKLVCDLPPAAASESRPELYLRAENKDKWIQQIANAVAGLSKTTSYRPMVIVEGIEMLHVLGIWPVQEILDFVSDLQEIAGISVISVSGSNAVLRGATSLSQGQEALFFSLLNRASAVFSIRSLDSGYAKDVTGVIRITKGGQPSGDGKAPSIDEGEYHYFVGEGNLSGVRVFEKGHS